MQHCRKNMNAPIILSRKGIRATAHRMEILDILINSSVALSEKQIRDKLKKQIDRATIYRALKTFTVKEIIHPVFTENDTTKFLIKKEPEEHIHFKCRVCNQVICLPEIQLGNIILPEGFEKDTVNFVVTGTCKNCNA